MKIDVIGAGLAGCECAMQIADRGFEVNLIEMKPIKKSPAHHVDTFAELVCSNSLKSNDVNTAGGLLKEELRILGSHVIECADKTRVPAITSMVFFNVVIQSFLDFGIILSFISTPSNIFFTIYSKLNQLFCQGERNISIISSVLCSQTKRKRRRNLDFADCNQAKRKLLFT